LSAADVRTKGIARYLFQGIFAGMVACVVIAVLILISHIANEYAWGIEFESAAWKEAEGSANKIRVRMIDSLLRKHTLVGMTRTQIDSLLGTPNKTSYFSDYEYVFWLGPERGFMSIDSEWLALKFKDNIVAEAVVLRD
jgi:hypothetical protein